MENPWKSTLAGIFDIVAGGSDLIGGLVLAMLGAIAGGAGWFLAPDEPFFPFAAGMTFFLVLAVICLVIGTLAVVGGIHTLQRRRWGWAIVGSVAATFAFFPLGIPAIVLTVLAEDEFTEDHGLPAVPTPPQPRTGA